MRRKIPDVPFEVRQLALYKHDIVAFARDCIFTLDSVDRNTPIKPYPIHLDYLQWMLRQMVEEELLIIVKHRRLVITWTYCLVLLHDAMFMEGRFNGIVSKKEEDSDELVRRCKFMYENIPDNKLPLKPQATYKYTELRFNETDSVIKGVAQGPDQLRQYTCSRVGCDEMAFWPQARQTFTALKPTLEGGGKVCLFSTRWPGFFQELVEDRLDGEAA